MSTVTKRRTTESAAVASSTPPLIVTAADAMSSHTGLQAAKQKMRSLDEQRAVLQAEHDQLSAAASNPDLQELSEKILAGESLEGIDSAAEKRDVLRLKLQGFAVALNAQRIVIERETRAASVNACDAIAPSHRVAADRLMNAFLELKGAVDDLQAVKSAIDQNGVTADGRLVFYHLIELQTLSRRLAHMLVNDWNPWVSRQAE